MLEKLLDWAAAQNLKNLPVVNTKKRGPGWTRAQVQRQAAKKRNQLKNRQAHR